MLFCQDQRKCRLTKSLPFRRRTTYLYTFYRKNSNQIEKYVKMLIDVSKTESEMNIELKFATKQFYMGDSSRTSKTHYGMGLYIVKAIVELHKGKQLFVNFNLNMCKRSLCSYNLKVLTYKTSGHIINVWIRKR